ncbi:hypothetical protein [Aliidiomarina quisquiliarum]|uniref:hypothetical protein n=1 Tax=Aliidiomarina quisquiliarum TaxID=2938947 RepID=UPI00208E691F|nr:hypothetical protein [Aliidiomarina quisquiliarum]MCO4319903.1 hypothetical protein [Aliidiomarina quisquiliarum]
MTKTTALPSWIKVLLVVVVSIAITVTITATQTRNSIEISMQRYHEAHGVNVPKIMVVNMEEMNKGFMENGADTRTALRAINAVIGLLDKEGYLVLHSSSALSVPEAFGFITDDHENIIAMAEREGIDINSGVDNALRAARQFMEYFDSL